MEIKDVQRLAELARIDIPDSEAEILTHDLDAILGYIKQIETASIGQGDGLPCGDTPNTVRDDIAEKVSSSVHKSLIDNMPQVENGFLKVKKIL